MWKNYSHADELQNYAHGIKKKIMWIDLACKDKILL